MSSSPLRQQAAETPPALPADHVSVKFPPPSPQLSSMRSPWRGSTALLQPLVTPAGYTRPYKPLTRRPPGCLTLLCNTRPCPTSLKMLIGSQKDSALSPLLPSVHDALHSPQRPSYISLTASLGIFCLASPRCSISSSRAAANARNPDVVHSAFLRIHLLPTAVLRRVVRRGSVW